AQQQMAKQEEDACGRLVPGDTHRDLRVSTQLADLAGRLLYLPVWLASFQYQGKLYRCAVNGQTGQIGGEAPVSRARVALVIVGIAAAVMRIILLFRLLGPSGPKATPTPRPTPAVRRCAAPPRTGV